MIEHYAIPFEGDFIVRGVASTNREADGTILMSQGCQVGRLPIPLLFEHRVWRPDGQWVRSNLVGPGENLRESEVGQVVEVAVGLGSVEVVARINGDPTGQAVRALIAAGDIRGFSVLAELVDDLCPADADDLRTRSRLVSDWKLREVSLSRNPHNADCQQLEVIKCPR